MTATVEPARTDVTIAATGRRFVALVVAATAVLQLLWIVVVPPFRGSDEFDHVFRAAAVASGDWRATQPAEDGRGLLVSSPGSLVEAARGQCESLGYTGPDNCTPAEVLDDGRVLVGSGAGGYNPAYYLPVGLAASPFDGAAALYVMRAVSALMCLLFIGLAAWAVSTRSRRAWSSVGLVLAMTPVMTYSTAIVAPNGLEMAAALCLWACALALSDEGSASVSRPLLWCATTAAVVLAVDRTLGPLFVLCIVLTAWCLDPSLVRRLARRTSPVEVGAACTVVLAAVVYAGWWYVTANAVLSGEVERQGGTFSWTTPILWVFQSIAAFPLRDQPGHLVMYPIALLALVTLVVTASRQSRGRARVVLALTVLTSFAIPLLLTWGTMEERGAMWQGRYGLPYAIGIVLVASVALDRARFDTRWRTPAVTVGSVAMTVGLASCLVKLSYDEMARPASVTDSAWWAPPGFLIVGGVVTVWLLYRRALLDVNSAGSHVQP